MAIKTCVLIVGFSFVGVGSIGDLSRGGGLLGTKFGARGQLSEGYENLASHFAA